MIVQAIITGIPMIIGLVVIWVWSGLPHHDLADDK